MHSSLLRGADRVEAYGMADSSLYDVMVASCCDVVTTGLLERLWMSLLRVFAARLHSPLKLAVEESASRLMASPTLSKTCTGTCHIGV